MMTIFDDNMIHMDIVDEEYNSNYSGYRISFSNGYSIEIDYDEISESPREWYNVTTMLCWHDRYDLGDKQQDMSYYDTLSDLIQEIEDSEGKLIWKPLYLYDHSGLSMSTSSELFGAIDRAGWDWSCVGIIYMTHQQIKENWGVDEVTDELIQKSAEILDGDVSVYDQYLRGEVYCYGITDGDGNHVDSLCGLYDFDYAKSEAIDAAEWHWNHYISQIPIQGVLDFED